MQRDDIILDDRLPSQYREKSEELKDVEHSMREAIDAMREFLGKEPYDEDELDQPDWFLEDKKKEGDYSEADDRELVRARDILTPSKEIQEVRRAEVEDKYPEGNIPERNYIMPKQNRDIIAVLAKPLDLNVLGEAADQIGIPNRRSDWDNNLRVTFPHIIDPEDEGELVVRYEEDEHIYVLGGGLDRYHGNLGSEPHEEKGSLFYENGEPIERLALLEEYSTSI